MAAIAGQPSQALEKPSSYETRLKALYGTIKAYTSLDSNNLKYTLADAETNYLRGFEQGIFHPETKGKEENEFFLKERSWFFTYMMHSLYGSLKGHDSIENIHPPDEMTPVFFFNRFLQENVDISPKLFNCLDSYLGYEADLKILQKNHSDTICHKTIGILSEQLSSELTVLADKEMFLFPSGWRSNKEMGHIQFTVVKKNGDAFDIYVINTRMNPNHEPYCIRSTNYQRPAAILKGNTLEETRSYLLDTFKLCVPQEFDKRLKSRPGIPIADVAEEVIYGDRSWEPCGNYSELNMQNTCVIDSLFLLVFFLESDSFPSTKSRIEVEGKTNRIFSRFQYFVAEQFTV